MGKLYFKVGADYDKVIRLREECKRLETQLISMNKNLDPKAFREVEKQMQSTKKEYMAIATEAGRAGAEMGEKLKRQIFDSSKAVNTMSEKISDQRVKVMDLSIEVRTLAESYRTMDKSNPQRTALKSQLDAVRASLTKEKDTLFGLQTEQGKNRLSVKKLRDEYALYDDKVRSTVTTNNHLGTSFKSILAGAGIVFSAQQAFQLAKSIVQVRGEFQQLDVAFTTLLQSKEKANILMGQMTELAAKTHFSLMEVATGAKQLTAYGFKAEEITGTLSRLGDIASGLSLPMERLTYLYGTTMTQGRLYARDLTQFTTSGIPMLQGLADMYGVTTEEVNKMVSAGTIGFPEVKKVIENLTNEGGKFFNLMEEQSKIITGKISNLGDAIDIMFNKMGQSQEGVINGAIDGAKYLVENYESILKIIQSLVVAYGAYKAVLIFTSAYHKSLALIETAKGFAQMTVMLRRTTQAQALLNQVMGANPILKIISLLIAAGTALYLFSNKVDKAAEAIERIDKAQKDMQASITIENSKIDASFSKLKLATKGTKEYETAKKAIIDQYESYGKGVDKEITSLENIELAYRKIKEAARESIIERIRAEQLGKSEEVATKGFSEAIDNLEKGLNNSFKDGYEQYAEHLLPIIREALDAENTTNLPDNKAAIGRVMNALKQSGFEKGAVSIYSHIGGAIQEYINVSSQWKSEVDRIDKKLGKSKKNKVEGGIVAKTSTYAEDYKAAKADWEQKKKILIEIEKDKTKFTTKAYEDAKNAEDVAKKKYSSLGGDTSDKKTNKEIDWNKLNESKISAETKYREAQISNSFEMQQFLVDMMEDGGEKELAQINLNYEKKKEAINKWEKEQRQVIIDAQKASYVSKNGSDKGFKVNEKDTAFKFVDNGVAIKNKANEKDKATTQAEGLNKMLVDYQNYFEKVTKIDEKYSKDRTKLEEENKKRGGNDEEILRAIAVLDEKQKEEQDATDLYYAQKQDSFIAWTNSIADFGLKQLEDEIAKAQKELNKLGGSKDDKKVSEARAKVTTLQKQINKENVETDTAPKKRDFKEWQKLQKTLNDVAGSFEEIGEEIGGMAGESIATVGILATNMTSMIDGILTFATTGIQGIKGVGDATATAIKTVEAASVILMIISAAIQVAMKIAELFSKDKELSEETIESYETFMDVTDDLIAQQKELLETLTGVQAIMVSDEALKTIEKQVEATRSLGKEYLASAAKRSHTYGKKTWERLSDNRSDFESVGIDYNKLKGSGRAEGLFDLTVEQLNDFRYKLPKVWAELDDETRKYLDSIMGSEEKMQEVIEMRNEALTGMSLDDARSELLDFLNDTEMTMEDVAENFEESMKNAINRIITNKTLSEGLEDWYTNFTKAMSDGTLTDIEKAQLQQEYESAYKKATTERDAAYEAAGIKTTTPAEEQSATSKGFETMSQETASKLDGSFLSLRITATDIRNQGLDKIKLLSKMDVNLGQVLTVSNETKSFVEEIKNIQRDSFYELQGINKNTGTMSKTLDKMAYDIGIMKDKL